MNYRVISRSNVTLLIHHGEIYNAEDAEQAVRDALEACGYDPWQKMCIDIFEGAEDSLLIATPADAEYASIADYAIPILREYLTD